MNEVKKGAILVISGPSGCGKSSLLKEVYKKVDNYYFSISTTTRDIRDGEKEGVDYYFVSKEEFEQDINDGLFLEHAKVHNNYYGTSLKPIIHALNEGKLVIFDIDVQGHRIIRQKLNDITTSVFVTTPSLDILRRRLAARNTDSADVILRRISNAKEEILDFDKYDFLLINDDLQKASEELISIAKTAMLRTKLFDKEEIIKQWSM